MVIVEKSFPRGGTVVKENKTESSRENIIFGALQKKIKKPKAKRSHKLDDDDVENVEEDEIKTVSAELLNYQTIQDDMNIMGMVKAVDQLHLSVALPGRMMARVSALEISDAYTKATKNFIENPEYEESYKPLKDLYTVGQIVYGRVQEIKQQSHNHTEIQLSLKPAQVHSELVHANIKKGFIFNGAIEEVQEHGYIIESGIRGLRTFMPQEKSKSTHVIGELVFLKVEKITHDTAAGTCICKEIGVAHMHIKKIMDPNLDYMLPSVIVSFTVKKIVKNGLQGTIMNEAFTAYINEHQLNEALALPEDFEVGATLQARILYVMPLTKLVYLTLKLHNSSETDATMQQFKRGDIIEDARVHHMGTGGVIMVLNNKFKGVISYRTIKTNYKGNYDQDELLNKYAKKSKHTVRVLDYDLIDSLYVCTDDANIVNAKVFTFGDVKPGEIVTAIVKKQLPHIGGYALQVGQLNGIIEKLFLSKTTLKIEDKIRCRVISVDGERKIIYLTNRSEYMKKKSKVLTSLSEASANSIFIGTVVKSTPAFVLVKFFNHLKGMLFKQELQSSWGNSMDSFYVGQTMPFRIVSKNGEQISLGLTEDSFALGEISPVKITNTLESGLEIVISYFTENAEDTSEINSLIPIRLLSDHIDLLLSKLRMFAPDTEIQAACVGKNIFSLRDVDYYLKNITKEWRTLTEGDILKAVIKNVTDDVVELVLPIRDFKRPVKAHVNMLLVNAFENSNITFTPEQVVYVKIVTKDPVTKTIAVTGKITDVWDGQLSSTAEYMGRYLKEVKEIKEGFQKQGRKIGKYTLGQKISVHFVGIHADTNDWLYEVPKSKVQAVVKASLVNGIAPPEAGSKHNGVIVWIDYSNEILFITTRPSEVANITSCESLPANFERASGINAKVLCKHDTVFVCALKKNPHLLVYCPIRLHFNDFENSASFNVKEGEFCKLTFIHNTQPIAVLESTWKLWQNKKTKRKGDDEKVAVETKKAKLMKKEDLAQDKLAIVVKKQSAKKEKKDSTDKVTKKKAIEKVTKVEEALKSGNTKNIKNLKRKAENTVEATPEQNLFYEDTAPNKTAIVNIIKASTKEKVVAQKAANEAKKLPGVDNFWSTDLTQLCQDTNGVLSSDDDDDDSANPTVEKKKLSAGEKFKRQREEEERLRAIEARNADPNQVPESVDQFDRLVLSDPNNSKNWINYMVFHLQSTEIDKARAVARRAIKSITFRNNDEQLNIWVALLNLELRYGSKESYDETLKEALACNDALKVYLRNVDILVNANKKQELIELIGIITKKFKSQQDMWKAAANAYFSIDMTERAQQLLQKALASLPAREHVSTIVLFANLNHKHGHNEMAQTLLDQVVTSYPKRVDVWTQYIDMLVKVDLIDSARAVLDRAVIQPIPLKKMRTIFKKYLEFEERFGTDEDVLNVKTLATQYVKKNSTV